MALLRDKEVAELIGMSASWVRVQRHKRKTNQPHELKVDSVFIGRAARYRSEDIDNWLRSITTPVREAPVPREPAPATLPNAMDEPLEGVQRVGVRFDDE